MQSILPFDEMNNFALKLSGMFPEGKLPPAQEAKQEEEDIIDEMLDLFLLAYATGNNITNANLSFGWEPPISEVMETVDKEVAGKTWRQRVEDYFANGGTGDDLIRIVETEVHRIANTAALDTAIRAGATKKTWHCMMLPTSRDTHVYLDGMTIPINDEFYSFKGDSTQFPGQWGIAEEDVNCMCWLSFE